MTNNSLNGSHGLTGNSDQLGSQQIFPGMTYDRQDSVEEIRWANLKAPKSTWLYLSFTIGICIAIPVAIFLSIRLIDDLWDLQQGIYYSGAEIAVAGLFVVLSWLVVVVLGHFLLRLLWVETVVISDEAIVLGYDGPLAPKNIHYDKNEIWCLSFERVQTRGDQEASYTLNLFDIDDRRRHLGYWIRPQEGYLLYLLLERIFEQRGWMVQSRTTYKGD